MRRFIALVAVVLLVGSACGGDSDDGQTANEGDQPDAAEAPTTEPAQEDANATETTAPSTEDGADGDDGSDSEGSGPSTATVTLGDETYMFSTEGAIVAQCLTNLFGIFSVQLPMIDAGGAPAEGSVSIVALHEGTDPEEVGEVNSIEVSVGDEDWVADEADMMFESSDQLEPGMSQVDSVEVDGRTVRGTATFFRQSSLFTGEIEILTGTFEATCGEERTT